MARWHYARAWELWHCVLDNTHQASTHPGQASRQEACRNWVTIAASWCGLKGSLFSTSNAMRRPIDSSDSIERATGGPLSGPVATAMYLRPWVAAVVSRRAFLQSKVPLLTEQCGDGSCRKICTTNSAKGCHLFLQLLGHSASASRTPIRLFKSDRQCRVVSCSDRSSVMSHNDEIYYGAVAHCLPPLLGDVKALLFEARACWHLYLWWQTSSLLRGLHFNPRPFVVVSYLLSNIYVYIYIYISPRAAATTKFSRPTARLAKQSSLSVCLEL